MLQRLRTEKKKLLGGCSINKAGGLMLIVSKSTENFFQESSRQSIRTCREVVKGDPLLSGDLEVERLSEDWDRRVRFLAEGDLDRLRDFFRRESDGEFVWLLPFFFLSFTSFGSIA